MAKPLTPEQIKKKEEARRKREEKRKERARAKKAKQRQRNHLRPLTDKQLRKRAAAAAKAAYKPTMVELASARKRNDELIEKRRADTAYFRDWLDRRLAEYDQSAWTTEAATESKIDQSMADTQSQYDDMRAGLLERAQQYGTGNTNLEGYSGFNTDVANQQAQDQLQLSREQLARLATVSAGMRGALSQNSAAYLASLASREEDAYRTADTEIRDARTKALAERGALQSETYLKLKNLELDKAEIRFDRRMSKAEIRLKKAALRLDRARIDADLAMNAADNATDITVAGMDGGGSGGSGGGGGDPVDLRARKKNTRNMSATLSSASQIIRSNKKLRNAWNRGNLSQIRKQMQGTYGFPPFLFPALFSMMRTGKLSGAAKQAIIGAGGIPRLIGGVQKLPKQTRGDFRG